jgi:hypothetical protein
VVKQITATMTRSGKALHLREPTPPASQRPAPIVGYDWDGDPHCINCARPLPDLPKNPAAVLSRDFRRHTDCMRLRFHQVHLGDGTGAKKKVRKPGPKGSLRTRTRDNPPPTTGAPDYLSPFRAGTEKHIYGYGDSANQGWAEPVVGDQGKPRTPNPRLPADCLRDADWWERERAKR